MGKRIQYTLTTLLAIAVLLGATALPALAVLDTGPIDPVTGFPTFVSDTGGVFVEPCAVIDPVAIPDGPNNPPCGGLELVSFDPAAGGFVDGNIAEFTFWRAETDGTGPNGESYFARIEIQGGVLPPVNIANGVRIRLRSLVLLGDYTVTIPAFGTAVFTAVDADGNGLVDNIDDELVPGALGFPTEVPAFLGMLNGPNQFFMSNGTGGEIPPGSGNFYLGDGITPGLLIPVPGGPTAAQMVLSVTDPNGVTTTSDQYAVEGKLIGCTDNVAPLAADKLAVMPSAAGGTVAINMLSNDYDGDPRLINPLAALPDVPISPGLVTITVPPANGSATVSIDGIVTYTRTGAATTDSFSYTVMDLCGAVSNEATVFIESDGIALTRSVLRTKLLKWQVRGTAENPGSAASAAGSTETAYGTGLSGAQEVPSNNSTAAGNFSLVVDTATNDLIWTFQVTDTGGQDITQAHIHSGAPGTNGGIDFFLCTNLGNAPAGQTVSICPPGPFTIKGILPSTSITGTGAADFAGFLTNLAAGNTYVNVHSVANAGGEIRGQLANNVVTVHAGNANIGSAAVDGGGEWSFNGLSSGNPGGSGQISVRTSNGTEVLGDFEIR